MTIRVRGASFLVDVQESGRRVRFAAPTKELARLWEQQARAALMEGKEYKPPGAEKVPAGSTYTLGAAIKAATLARWQGTAWGKTAEGYAWDAADFLGRGLPLDSIKSKMIASYAATLPNTPTKRRRLSSLSAVFSHAVAEFKLDARPQFPRFKREQGRIRYLSLGEERKVLAFAVRWPESLDLWTTLVDTGARLGEALRIRKRDVEADLLAIPETKNGESRGVYLTPRVLEVLRRRSAGMRDDDKLFSIRPRKTQEHWSEMRAGIGLAHDGEFVIHALRHTCASRLVQGGVPLVVVQKVMGHKSFDMTLKYAHLAPDNTRQAAEALSRVPRDVPRVPSEPATAQDLPSDLLSDSNAQERTRTSTGLPPLDPENRAESNKTPLALPSDPADPAEPSDK